MEDRCRKPVLGVLCKGSQRLRYGGVDLDRARLSILLNIHLQCGHRSPPVCSLAVGVRCCLPSYSCYVHNQYHVSHTLHLQWPPSCIQGMWIHWHFPDGTKNLTVEVCWAPSWAKRFQTLYAGDLRWALPVFVFMIMAHFQGHKRVWSDNGTVLGDASCCMPRTIWACWSNCTLDQ